MRVERLVHRPIISAETDPSIGENIQGPSLIRVPNWADNPLGNYYLYFADHKGTYIRLAYADDLAGTWQVYKPGSLQLSDSRFLTAPADRPPDAEKRCEEARLARGNGPDMFSHDPMHEFTTPHIASPDVHIDEHGKRIVMYFHGLESFASQRSRVALSYDGIHFKALPDIIGPSYMRIFNYGKYTYALAMPGQFYRSKDGLTDFETGPALFNKDMRHSAVLVREDELFVFWTQVGHAPERILLSRIDMRKPWSEWAESEPEEVMRPEYPWEGADEPLLPSIRSVVYGRANQLRDPAIYQEGNRTYLLYAVAGEGGIAIAEITF